MTWDAPLFGGERLPLTTDAKQRIDQNPLVRAYGFDPKGRLCGGCALLSKHRQSSRAWFKCALRAPGGRASDHFARWNACAKFQEAP